MTNLILPRRNFLLGLASLFAAPAVIRVASIMPISSWEENFVDEGGEWVALNVRFRLPLAVAMANDGDLVEKLTSRFGRPACGAYLAPPLEWFDACG